jgi:quinol monooxygenase YgiN
MIAILDARPGMADPLREVVAELARQVRREPGCLTFTAYQARDTLGRFYLYEVYASAAAFEKHLQAKHVHDFIAAVPVLSTAEPEASCNSTKSPSTRGVYPPAARRMRTRRSKGFLL